MLKMQSFIGDDIKACKLWLFADSDHAGEHDNKSASGGFLALVGPNTYYPLAAFSKKQTSIAVSSTEAEVVCANVALRALGLPSSALWSVLQNAGGHTSSAITRLTAATRPLPKHPDPLFCDITKTGQYSLQDGRIAFATTDPTPIRHAELSSHPIRDVWLLQNGKWSLLQRAVAWEEISIEDDKLPNKVEACLFVFRRSVMDRRRHTMSEAELQRECEGIRNTGGVESTSDYIRANPKDIGLIMSVPHSIQPVVLEDNQATIRILESGKSPAFRHADKTQRINLGWLSEQFRRKHYQLAYISTSLQAADILTKPFTSIDKWTKALKLIAVGEIKSNARSSGTVAAPPSTVPSAAASRPLDVGIKRLIVEVCCSSDSLLGQIAVKEFKDCHVARITEEYDLNKSSARRDVISLVKSCNKHNIPTLVWASLPCTGGSSWSHVNLTLPGNREKVIEARKKFVKLSCGHHSSTCAMDSTRLEFNTPLNGQSIVCIGIGPVSESGSKHVPFTRRISTDAVLV